MITQRAVSAVEDILKAASFDVEPGTGGASLTAYRGEECLLVLCSDNPDEINDFAVKKYKYKTDGGFAYCKKLLFTMKKVGYLEECTVWGHEELAKYAGQAVIADILGEHIALDFEYNSQTASPSGAVGAQKSGVMTLDDYGPELVCLPENITADRAQKMAGIRGEVCFVYIPHYLYTCTSRGEKQCGKYLINFDRDEKGLINAITGSKCEIESEKLENVKPETKNVSGGAKVMDAKVKKSEISESLLKSLVEDLTKNVRVNHSEGDAIYYEDLKVAPDKDNIKVELELVYLPVVQIRGDKIVEIDMMSGEILREPVDDGVELL